MAWVHASLFPLSGSGTYLANRVRISSLNLIVNFGPGQDHLERVMYLTVCVQSSMLSLIKQKTSFSFPIVNYKSYEEFFKLTWIAAPALFQSSSVKAPASQGCIWNPLSRSMGHYGQCFIQQPLVCTLMYYHRCPTSVMRKTIGKAGLATFLIP